MQIVQIKGSSNIAGAGYDPEGQRLTVVFMSGRRYTYEEVPQDIYEALLQADSAGKFFNSNIKDQYRYSG